MVAAPAKEVERFIENFKRQKFSETLDQKCIVIPFNNHPSTRKQDVYGKNIFYSLIDSVLTTLIGHAQENYFPPKEGNTHEYDSKYWTDKLVNHPYYLGGKNINIFMTLDGVTALALITSYDEKIMLKKLGLYVTPLFQFEYNSVQSWIVIDVKTIMPTFEERWKYMYQLIAKELSYNLSTGALGKDVHQMMLDYMGEWIPAIHLPV